MTTVCLSRGRRRRRAAATLSVLLLAILAAWGGTRVVDGIFSTSTPAPVRRSGAGPADRVRGPAAPAWPIEGEAAVAVGRQRISWSGASSPVPIASLAKVMTAVVVLRGSPLDDGDDGFVLTITARDVADTSIRRAQGQSVVPVAAGEQLTERQALQAVLLPSANNVAVILARAAAGNTAAFVAQMNNEAHRLGMSDTRYTDPSGFDAGTVSTARDQVRLARAAMRIDDFAELVRTTEATLPVAGPVRNTNTLLGRAGVVGIKTGSDSAAGGCFMFAVRQGRGSHVHTIYGAVLGQRDGPLIAAGLQAGLRLAGSVTRRR